MRLTRRQKEKKNAGDGELENVIIASILVAG